MEKQHRIKINILFMLGALIPLLVLSGCTQQSNNYGGNTVSIQNLAFNPSTLTVTAGTTVTWINNDNVDHNVMSSTGAFSSGTLANGQSYTYTFNTPGTYDYSCTIHPSMKGTIIVQ